MPPFLLNIYYIAHEWNKVKWRPPGKRVREERLGKIESEVRALLDLMKEETIAFNLDNAKTPKEKRLGYSVVQVQLENKGKIFFIRVWLLSLLL